MPEYTEASLIALARRAGFAPLPEHIPLEAAPTQDAYGWPVERGLRNRLLVRPLPGGYAEAFDPLTVILYAPLDPACEEAATAAPAFQGSDAIAYLARCAQPEAAKAE